MAQEPGFCMMKWAGVLIFPNPTPWMRCMKDRGTCRSPQGLPEHLSNSCNKTLGDLL